VLNVLKTGTSLQLLSQSTLLYSVKKAVGQAFVGVNHENIHKFFFFKNKITYNEALTNVFSV
jgi:hypothetical protein